MAKIYDLEFSESETFYLRFELHDAEGDALDLTDATTEWIIAALDGSGATMTASSSNGLLFVTSDLGGEGYVLISPADHLAITAGEYSHELRATLADTTVTTQITGKLTVGASAFVSNDGLETGLIRSSGMQITFDSGTSDADPGDGLFRFNNAAPGSATYVYIDRRDRFGVLIVDWIDLLDDSTNPSIKGFLRFTKIGQESTWYEFAVSGAVVSASGYRKIPVTYIAGAGTLSEGDNIAMTFARSGDSNGYPATPNNLGTISSGTVTPDPANGLFQRYRNDGNHTLNPPSVGTGDSVSVVIQITETGSAGTVNISGFSDVTGTFVGGNDFICRATVVNGWSLIEINKVAP